MGIFPTKLNFVAVFAVIDKFGNLENTRDITKNQAIP